ncbi:MAG TPA: hypothetical protein DIS90_09660 [Cytophagales bacterium]|nr:hypothetical protein [Cytophagales bacterium]HCR53228.1 hypothetical protein [Cytophagales bacterium]
MYPKVAISYGKLKKANCVSILIITSLCPDFALYEAILCQNFLIFIDFLGGLLFDKARAN